MVNYEKMLQGPEDSGDLCRTRSSIIPLEETTTREYRAPSRLSYPEGRAMAFEFWRNSIFKERITRKMASRYHSKLSRLWCKLYNEAFKSKRIRKPRKNKSIQLVIEGIMQYQPKVFMIENVPRLMNLMPEKIWQEALPNYNISFKVNSVSDFGNSQVSRKRLIIIGIKIPLRVILIVSI